MTKPKNPETRASSAGNYSIGVRPRKPGGTVSRPRLFDSSLIGSAREALDFITGILESSTEYSIIGKDLDGTIVLWNEGARRIYGYEPDEVVGRASSTLLHVPEDVEAGVPAKIMQAALRDGYWEGTLQRVRRNGERFPDRIVITPRRDGDGNAVGILLISKDISEELRLVEERNAHYYSRSLIEASLDPFFTISPEGIVTDVNVASEEVTGLPRKDLIGTDFADYFTDRGKAREGYQRVFSEGFVRDYELEIRHVEGGTTDVLYSASVYTDHHGKVLGAFAAARDVTDRKRYEQSLLEANRMKSEFLAGMSHELRTPLNGIIGFTEFLVDEKPDPLTSRQKEYLNYVLSSAGHLLQLINDVLDLGKVEAGRMELRPETFSVRQAVTDVTAITNGAAGKRLISVNSEVGEGLEEVYLDQHKFKQVLYNLLSNAVKFTDPEGRVDVTARRIASEGGGGGDRLEIQVSDTGIGIRAEDMGKLFSEFEQLDSGIARRFEGAGLGLALTRKIVEFQGGSVGVCSEPGKGSMFSVVLPLTGSEAESR